MADAEATWTRVTQQGAFPAREFLKQTIGRDYCKYADDTNLMSSCIRTMRAMLHAIREEAGELASEEEHQLLLEASQWPSGGEKEVDLRVEGASGFSFAESPLLPTSPSPDPGPFRVEPPDLLPGGTLPVPRPVRRHQDLECLHGPAPEAV